MLTDARSNIVLVGMPGAGKSTIGVILAKHTARDFVDTDVLIQTAEGRALQDIVDRDGYLELRRIEERVILGLHCRNHVIATGGSAVYSEAAMRYLKTGGRVVFLDAAFGLLKRRIADFNTRGIACRPGMSFRDLFEERRPLYLRHADVIVRCGRQKHEAVSQAICEKLDLAHSR